MQRNKPVSMKEISKLSGVSIATVSRVINNNGRFSEETKQRVENVIKEYGYRPSIMAKGLRNKKVQNIGIIVPDITNEFFAKIVLEIQKHLYEYNYSALIYNTDELDELEQEYVSMLAAQNVSGVIYIAGGSGEKTLTSINVPTVFVDRNPLLVKGTNKNVVFIESNNVEGGYIATKELLRSGSKLPAILMDKRQISPQTGRFIGYQKALFEYGIPFSDDNVIKVDKVDFDNAYNAVSEKIEKGCGFDSLFCTTDWLVMGALHAFDKLGVKVPSQMKVVGFDNISISEYGIIPFSTISQDIHKLGSTAAEVIIQMIQGEDIGSRHYTFPVKLIKRKSTML